MLCKRNGFGIMEAIIGIGICVFLILPVSAYLLDKGIIIIKAGLIRDSVDLANLSLYNAMDIDDISSCAIGFDEDELIVIYRSILAKNLRLDSELEPSDGSLADGPVRIISLQIYLSGFPVVCPYGKTLDRPAVHSVIAVPVKPSFYMKVIKELTGIGSFDLTIHTDTEIPVNN